MKDYIEERAIEIANFIIEEKATVRQTAKKFGVSKSTVHTDGEEIWGVEIYGTYRCNKRGVFVKVVYEVR